MSQDGRKGGLDRRRQTVVEQLERAAGRPLSQGEVLRRCGLHPGERTELKRILRDLVREGAVVKEGKRYAVPAPKAPSPPDGPRQPPGRPAAKAGRRGVLGTLTRHRDGFGFVARADRKGEDLFLPPDEAAKALDGDLLRVEVVPGRGGRTQGRVVEVVERRRRWLLGTYHATGGSSFVVPSDRALQGHVAVAESALARDGDVVKVALAPGLRRLEGEVVERVGRPGDPRVEVLEVAYAKGFSDLFPDDVRAAAELVPDHVREEDRVGRRDLTQLRLVTIDGEDARDFDDAVFVERTGAKGRARWRLVVAIADVAHYVRSGGALDAEALRRGTSVYFPAQVLPMLPERLSNGICSLNPAVDRLCMVADLRIDDRGDTVGAEIYRGVMRSAARCTYDEVARVLAGEHVPHRAPFRADFAAMAELQEKLTDMRARRGSIDFDIPESKVVLDEDGKVRAIERRPRNRAHRVVEEFMLAANEAVARHFSTRELPTVYRVHGLPDEDKLDAFRRLAAAHGFDVPEGPLGPRQLNALLDRIEGHAQQRALNQLLLRAMMQAVYSPDNVGHYGLAAEHYLHFTSPIRRYPDLMVHRLLEEDLGLGGQRGGARQRDLEEVAILASERERAAMQAEREVAAFYAALFMQDKVGQRFQGVVATVVDFGLFVEIQPWFVEGLVKAEDLGTDVELDLAMHALVQRSSGRAFRVGDGVEVEVVAASPARRQIDLALVEAGEVRRAVPGKALPGRAGLEASRGSTHRQRGAKRGGQGREPARSDRPRPKGASKPRKGRGGGKRGRR